MAPNMNRNTGNTHSFIPTNSIIKANESNKR